MGRHSIISDEYRTEMERYLRAGVPIRWACEAVGISHVTHYDWIAKGDVASLLSEEAGEPIPDDDVPFVEYANATRKATALGKTRPVLELMRLAYDEEADEAVRARILQFFLTHSDREHWHPASASDKTSEIEETLVELEW